MYNQRENHFEEFYLQIFETSCKFNKNKNKARTRFPIQNSDLALNLNAKTQSQVKNKTGK